MGRLFWKVFLGFWLTMLMVASIAALLVLADRAGGDDDELLGRPGVHGDLLVSPWVTDRLLRHAQILRHGGRDALRDYVLAREERRGRSMRPRPAVFVTDPAGGDLLGRPVPAQALRQAREHAVALERFGAHDDARYSGGRRQADDETHADAVPAISVRDGGDRDYLLFSPRPVDGPLARRTVPLWARVPTWSLFVAGVTFSLAFSGLLAWYLARPIRALRAGLRRVAEGDLESRVAPLIGARRDELADLGRDLDRTTERLQQLLESQRRLLHDVSHELRSPLARLTAAVGIVRQTPARLPDMLDRLEQETERLDDLVGEILTLSRLEETHGHGVPVDVDLRELIADVAADAAFEAQGRAVGVSADDGPPAFVNGHPSLLLRAIENLVRNAVRFSPQGGRVTIELGAIDRGWRLAVADQGPGIAPDLLDKVLEPFVRGSQDGQGFGLGLAIARRAVEIHGGRLELSNRHDGPGLIATIELPRGQ
ncbi:MAG: HAMP domain-containing sensor histidine kinase [Burkholderiaceae bacterium]